MSGQIRNAAVAIGKLATAGQFIVYEVPAGNVLLLKAIGLYSLGAGPIHAEFATGAAPAGVYVPVLSLTIPYLGFELWNGWQALNELHAIYASVDAPTLHYWIAGALLPFNPVLGTTLPLLTTQGPVSTTTWPFGPHN